MSLVEVMVVIAIIVTLMGIIGYGVMTVWANSRVDTTILQMGEVAKRIDLYTLKHGTPSTSDGLKAVYGTDEPPKDSWGKDFIYVSPGPDGHDWDLVSYGADGSDGGTGNDADIKWSEVK
jgi:general secretion pathway protein G